MKLSTFFIFPTALQVNRGRDNVEYLERVLVASECAISLPGSEDRCLNFPLAKTHWFWNAVQTLGVLLSAVFVPSLLDARARFWSRVGGSARLARFFQAF
mmetsp:Transcript_5873/g.9507  ORF Transcript_5873/g.9507 Transcript_5873/m.9507 type:complete len:100 (+) Transcript_5873:89-388(+)